MEAAEEPVQVADGYALGHVGWDGPVPFESSMVHAVTVRSNLKGTAPELPSPHFDVQLIESAFPHAAAIVAGFDITRCMAAYDGASVWALSSDLDAAGELRGPSTTSINSLRLTGASFWQLLRTRRRLTKYAERGIACDADDADWLAAEMAGHVHDPHSLVRACAYGRLQEACALICAGADHTRVTGSALRVYNPAAPCFKPRAAGAARAAAAPEPQTSRPQQKKGLNDFRALLEDFVAVHAAPHAFAARAWVAASRVSKGFAAQVDGASGSLVARFVSGFEGGSLHDAYVGEQAAAVAASGAGARRAAAARVKAIKRALPPLAKTPAGESLGYGDEDDDDDYLY